MQYVLCVCRQGEGRKLFQTNWVEFQPILKVQRFIGLKICLKKSSQEQVQLGTTLYNVLALLTVALLMLFFSFRNSRFLQNEFDVFVLSVLSSSFSSLAH